MAAVTISIIPVSVKDNKAGKTFGTMLVIACVGIRRKFRLWKCKCVRCGNEALLETNRLSRPCRCEWLPKKRTGTTYPVERATWSHMKQRCINPNFKDYDKYGGRGISVCEAWLASFDAFLRDMGPRPPDKHSIDRIDSNGNYEPSNCRWATFSEQNKNRRNNRYFTHNGQRLCLQDWARVLNINAMTLSQRLKKMPFAEAIRRS